MGGSKAVRQGTLHGFLKVEGPAVVEEKEEKVAIEEETGLVADELEDEDLDSKVQRKRRRTILDDDEEEEEEEEENVAKIESKNEDATVEGATGEGGKENVCAANQVKGGEAAKEKKDNVQSKGKDVAGGKGGRLTSIAQDVVEEEKKGKDSSKALAKEDGDDDEDGDEEEEEEEEAAASEADEEEEEDHDKPAKSATKKAKSKKKNKSNTGSNAHGSTEAAAAAADRLRKADVPSMIFWKREEPIPYLFLSRTFEDISEHTGRLLIIEMLTNCFRAVMEANPEELLTCVYLAAGAIAPPHKNIEMGVGEAMLVKTLAEATGRNEKWIKGQFKEEGDLGKVAVSARSTQRTMFQPKPLTAKKVLETYRSVASTTGKKSSDEKRGKIKQLLVASRENEAGYIIRALQGRLRIGLAESTVVAALAQAVFLRKDCAGKDLDKYSSLVTDMETAVAAVKVAFSVVPSYDVLVPALIAHGTSKINELVRFTPGVPCKCMLSKPTKGVQEVVKRFADLEFTCEYKYDGERVQVHLLEDGSGHVYSRNAEDTSSKYPDVCSIVKKALKPGVGTIVIDGEVVAFDRVANRIEPFQKLSTRSKKDASLNDIKVNICVFAFDILYLNGRDVLQEPLSERRRLLKESFIEIEGEFKHAVSMISSDVEEMQAFLEASIRDGTEGLIVKTLTENATYEPSKRSLNWLKLKKDYVDSMGDSLDLVPIGAWHGKGKRTGVYGAFLLACYDEDSEGYQTICKVGTGFSEEVLQQQSEFLTPFELSAPPSYYDYNEHLVPDVWFAPKQVWEVKAADLSISPVHKAAMGRVDEAKGIALRFPRFIRIRDDKSTEQATSSEQIAELYTSQALVNQEEE